MKRPEDIKIEIDKLNNELKLSEQFYQYELLCDSSFSDDMIGFFNIGNSRKILTALYEGKDLQYRHGVYGNVDVYMNSQKNGIFVSENANINEDNIVNYIIWYVGEWYVKL